MGSIIGAIAGPVLKIGGSIISGSKRSKASKKAEAAAVAAQQRNDALAREGNAKIDERLQPYNDAGRVALSSITDHLDDRYLRNFTADDFHEDPGYQMSLEQGQRGLDRAANAHGGIFSGRQLNATADYNRDMANNQYSTVRDRWNQDRDAAYSKLTGLVNIGQNAVNSANQATSTMTGQAIDASTGIGTAQANGALERGLIGAQTWTNIMDTAASAVNSKGISSLFSGGK